MFQMNSMGIESKVRIFISILSGALIGYLVWVTYFWIGLPDWLIRGVINKRTAEFLTSLFGNSAASERALTLLIYFLKSILGAIVFGVIGGVLVARSSRGRIIVYASLIWPIWLYLSTYVLLDSFAQNPYINIRALWVRRSEHQELHLVMYSTFLIVLFMTTHIFNRTLKHNSSVNMSVAHVPRQLL